MASLDTNCEDSATISDQKEEYAEEGQIYKRAREEEEERHYIILINYAAHICFQC